MNIGRSFLKRLENNKIRVRFVTRLLKALTGKFCDYRINISDF